MLSAGPSRTTPPTTSAPPPATTASTSTDPTARASARGSGHAMICTPEELLLESRKPGFFTVTVDLARLEWLRDELDRRVDGTLPWRTKPGIFKQWIRPELYRGYERL